MNKIKCFKIKDSVLYLEVVLLEFDRIPMLFICRDHKDYYVALCTDLDELEYIVILAKPHYLVQMLRGKMPIRDIFMMQSAYYYVHSSNDIENDVVEYRKIGDMDQDLLPLQGAKYTIYTEEVESFTKHIEEELYDMGSFVAVTSENLDIIDSMPLCLNKETSLTITFFEENTNICLEEKRSSFNKFVVGTKSKIATNSILKESFETEVLEGIEMTKDGFKNNAYFNNIRKVCVFAA